MGGTESHQTELPRAGLLLRELLVPGGNVLLGDSLASL